MQKRRSAALYGVALAERRERSREVLEQETKSGDNETAAAMESGPPDSHEAMNNREIYPKIREKRSFEFLMGLINNNSRYEVTKVDPQLTTQKPMVTSANVAASEILLELMVRIAAHPDQWDKVHKLLRSIDEDLTTSRNVLNNLKRRSNYEPTKYNQTQTTLLKGKEYSPALHNRSLSSDHKNNTKKVEEPKGNSWPSFDEDGSSIVKVVNINETNTSVGKIPKYTWQTPSKPSKPTYQKNFAYHRVTGKPINLNKNPKAYIAVSVIAPKPTHTRSGQEDVSLENELHQLKPWTHNQNLKNMASIRSRWVIQSEQDKEVVS
ncbi:hypothetical protein JTB14_017377 [Gonioctena quinquepunctata]|nr:hypothetical protein JTB14_017377 [Gonioctena quinquepunctata]